MKHFLIVFDHGADRRVSCEEYLDADAALAAYARTEREYEGRDDLEIVLIGSDSIETVKKTHANYFAVSSGSEYLKGL